MRIALYARISTDDKGQELETQFIQLRQWLHNRIDDLAERVEHMEIGDKASGKTFANRPGWTDVISMCRSGYIDAVVVWKIDRISRSVMDLCGLVLQFDKMGIRLIVTSQNIDTDRNNPGSRLMINVLAAFAQFEREMIGERVKAGLERRRKEGGKIGKEKRIIDILEVDRLRKKGKSFREIGRLMEIDHTVISRRYKDWELQNFRISVGL